MAKEVKKVVAKTATKKATKKAAGATEVVECYSVKFKKKVPLDEGTITINKNERGGFMMKGTYTDDDQTPHIVCGLIGKERCEQLIADGIAEKGEGWN